MKTLHFALLIGISFSSFVFLMTFQNSYAYTCAVKAPSVPIQYYYLHSDSVFVGTVSSITNYTNHQLNVKFNVEKSWKGSQRPIITTYGLVACGYSLVEGEKYLVFANGSPLDYDPWATKSLANAQNEIVLLDSSQFQTQADANEILYKKLVNARDGLSSMMGSKISKIPISFVGVNDLNFTLDIGIADKKASLPSGAQAYKQKLEEIVGNVPIRILYAEYATALPEILPQHSILSPLKQFKSGIAAKNVVCVNGFALIIKVEDSSPACVKSTSLERLLRQGWVNAYDNNGKYLPIETPKTIKVKNSDFLLHYSITGGNVKESELDSQSLGLIISLNTTNNGTLTVTIPRALLDTTNDPGSQFIMLADGQQIEFKQIRITISDRTLSIPFQNGTSKLMILGTHY